MFYFSLRNVENCSCKLENCTGATTSVLPKKTVGFKYQIRTQGDR